MSRSIGLTGVTMDLITVREVRQATTRDEIVFGEGERPLGGGTWLLSEPQPGMTGLVDLTSMGWNALEVTDSHLHIAATCTFSELMRLERREEWSAFDLIGEACNSLLGSFKVWNVATIGGNICLALAAAPMTAFAAAMDATAVLWAPDGSDRSIRVADLVLGAQHTAIAPGEVMRELVIPRASLESVTGFRRISLTPLGRTATMVISRRDPSGEITFTVAGGTDRPHVLRFDDLPSASALESAVGALSGWFTDAHGASDWRRAMGLRFAAELRNELA